MDCNHCASEATIFLTKVENNGLKKFSLCESCAKDPAIIVEHGLEQALGTSLPASSHSENTELEKMKSCVCGFTLEDLQKTGRMGCDVCYQTFSELIDARIESIQRGTQHTGKQLKVELTDAVVASRLEKLNSALTEAISNEEFEKAAQLRDEIENLKKQTVS